jgi:pyruvate dehydrogenase E2 component (dihydrolipoamide acetyltransferase)
MPALEPTQETGKLVCWRKKEGEPVIKGEPLLEVETDKAVVEIEAPGDGILAAVKAQPGEAIPVGTIIAWIVLPGERPPADESVSAPSARTSPSASQTQPGALSSRKPLTHEGTRISPKARHLANEHGVDLAAIRGSGAGGEILASDILALVESGTTAGPRAPAGVEKLSTTARLMAERTTQSWTTVPHFFVTREMDASALLQAHAKLAPAKKRTAGVGPTLTDLLIALVARALLQHPRLNASWTGDAILINPEINISVAIAVEDGVVAAVVHKADSTGLDEIAVRRRDLTERARTGRLHPADIAGATFTISNLGMYSVDAFTAIINPPQAAILAVGCIADRVVPMDGLPSIRPMMTLTLSCDHRVVDGARAATFLKSIADAVGEPEKWLGGSQRTRS